MIVEPTYLAKTLEASYLPRNVVATQSCLPSTEYLRMRCIADGPLFSYDVSLSIRQVATSLYTVCNYESHHLTSLTEYPSNPLPFDAYAEEFL